MARVPIERGSTRLKVVHRQRVLRQGDAEPAPQFDRSSLDASVLAAAVSGWTSLLETEYESVVIASWMTSALTRIGAPLDVIGAFGRVVEDEIRHVDICAEMVEAFGERPAIPQGGAPPFPIHVPGPGAKEAEYELIAGLVGFFCVFEHLSAFVFRQAIEAAEAEIARWALSEIHRDEAFHGAFGFETAKVLLPRLDDGDRGRLGEHVAQSILRFERRLGGPLSPSAQQPRPREERALEKLGLLSPPELLSTFYGAVEGELLGRVAELGIPVDLRVEGRSTGGDAHALGGLLAAVRGGGRP